MRIFESRSTDSTPRIEAGTGRGWTLGLSAWLLGLGCAAVGVAQVPDSTWNLTDSSDAVAEVEDCTGAANQTDLGFHSDAGSGMLCQNYDTSGSVRDIYETLRPLAGGYLDSDVWFFRVGKDDDFFYFEIETVGSFNYDSTGANREYVFEVNVDFADPGDADRPDLYYRYFPDPATDIGSTWLASDEVSPVQPFRDTVNDYGATSTTFSDFGGTGGTSKYGDDWKDLGGTGTDSYNWYRIVTRTSTLPGPDDEIGTADDVMGAKNIVQVAIRSNTLCLTGTAPCTAPTDIAVRAWSSQSSSIVSDKLPWHDHQEIADLPTWDVDNCCGLGSLLSTPVSLAFFEAELQGDAIAARWTTATEVGNVGFRLYALDARGRWQWLGLPLYPAAASDAVEPRHYAARLSLAEPRPLPPARAALLSRAADLADARPVQSQGSLVALMLEDVDVRGHSRFHGPFALGTSYGSPVRSDAIDWPAVRAAHALAAKRGRGQAPEAVESVDLRVSEDGLVRVGYEALAAAGLDLDGVPARRIAVSRDGAPVPRHIDGGGRFGPGSSIELVGEALDTLYTGAAVYRVTVEASLAEAVTSTPAPAAPFRPEASYLATETFARQRHYSFGSPNGDPWFDTKLLAIGGPESATFPLALEDWVAGTAPITLQVEVWGVTDWPFEGDHHVVVEVNGVPLADAVFDGLASHTFNIEVADSLLVGDGSDTLRIVLPHDTGVAFDLVHVEGYTVRYPRAFNARDGVLDFSAAGRAFAVDGLTGHDVVVWREDARGVRRLTDLTVVETPAGFQAAVPGSRRRGVARYLVTSLDRARSPEVVPTRRGEELLIGDAELLIVSHADFIDGLAPLVAARRGEGLSVRVVDVEEVFGRYGHGVFDPEAIRAFVADAHRQLGTRYVLLVGADTYDYRDDLGIGSISFVPTLYAQTDDIVRFAPADALFGDVDGDRVPEVAVGRFPVRTAAELETVVAKTLAYATATPARTAIVAADKFDPSGSYSFRRDSEAMVELLGDAWSVERNYIDDLGLAGARAKLLDDFDQGAALVSFFGHSGPTAWTFSGLFTATDAADLGNVGRPAVVMQWGCWNTYYVSPQAETLGHVFMTSGDRGAAAVLGATTLTRAENERQLGLRFVAALTEPNMRLGDAVVAAKQDLAGSEGTEGLLDVIVGWTILGDPTIEVFH